MKVFIDAVIYIKLFSGDPSNEYFDELKKILEDKKFILIFPQITRNEVYRNVIEILKTEKKIASEEPKLTLLSDITGIKNNSVLNKLEKKYKNMSISQYKKTNTEKINTKIKMAKSLFGNFQKLTIDYTHSNSILELAKERKLKRYPPGKDGDPLGDQLVWELLLANCVDDDLIILSADGDWRDLTDLDQCNIHPLLLEEWKSKGNSKIELMDDLGKLIQKFKSDYKKPEEEIEKEKHIGLNTINPQWIVSPCPTYATSLGSSNVNYWTAVPSLSTGSTQTSTSTSTSSSTLQSWYDLSCYKCGRSLNSNGPYVIQNGLNFCTQCASLAW